MSKRPIKQKIFWNDLVNDLTQNFVKYHDHFYKYVGFTGPSLHFHHRALSAENDEKIEMVYAVLTSWGMHRMGRKGAKMNEFSIFGDSIRDCESLLVKFKGLKLEDCSEYDFEPLVEIFEKLNPMYSEVKIVGVSKVLAHYLPDIIAPVDRQYTFQFIKQKPKDTTLPGNWGELELLRELHLKLFKPVAENKQFRTQADSWIGSKEIFPWDTSIPKIIDNLIIGKLKGEGKLDDFNG